MGYDPVTIREAAQVEILLFVALAFVGGLGIVYWGFQTYQFGRLIRDTPPEPIGSVAMGRTEITGAVHPATRVYDQPFTAGQCVYGELTVREYKEYDDDDKEDEWETVQTDSFGAPFYIEDGTGRMLVEPNDDTLYEISEAHTTTVSVSGGSTPPGPVQDFLRSSSGSTYSSDDGGLLARIRGVFGIAGSEETVQGGDPDTVDMGTREEGDPAGIEHIRRSELGSVGTTSQDRRYIQTVLPLTDEGYVFGGATRPAADETVPNGEAVVLRADPTTGEFIISDKDEFELARVYRTRSVLYIGAGIVASAFILALLAQILLTGPLYGIEWALP